jgi:hypothetical protein
MRKVMQKDQHGVEREVIQFQAKLISVGKLAANTNGTPLRYCDIEFTNAKGEVKRSGGVTIYETNFEKGMEVGETYLATAIPTDQGVFVQLSHLQGGADKATADDFGIGATVASTTKKEKVELPA